MNNTLFSKPSFEPNVDETEEKSKYISRLQNYAQIVEVLGNNSSIPEESKITESVHKPESNQLLISKQPD